MGGILLRPIFEQKPRDLADDEKEGLAELIEEAVHEEDR